MIRIITDSASDISQELAKEWNITVIPLKVRFDEDEYLDGLTLSPHAFFEKLEQSDTVPKTSRITPYEYETYFKEAKDAGDTLICFTLSSGVSGSYDSACIAAQDYEGIVEVIDTKQFCVSEGIIVKRAADLRDSGHSFEDTVRIIKEELKEAHVVAVFDTLEYLKKGGRISAAAYFAGSLLSIRPVLTITDGVVDILAKGKGQKKCASLMKDYILELKGIDFERPVFLGYTGTNDVPLKKFLEQEGELFEGHLNEIPVADVGATIGTYAGPGAYAFAFFEKK